MVAILYIFKRRHSAAEDFPPWNTIYDPFSKGNKRGIWEKCLDWLTVSDRLKEGHTALPSYGIIDAQSVKTRYASKEQGIDGDKKVKRFMTPT